jgi:hypothetical protein
MRCSVPSAATLLLHHAACELLLVKPVARCSNYPPAEEGKVPRQEVEGLALAPRIITKVSLQGVTDSSYACALPAAANKQGIS